MVHRISVALTLAVMPFSACAQQVFKCVGDGAVSYQSAPCSAGQAAQKTWEYASYQPSPEAGVERPQVQPASPGRSRRASSPPRQRRAASTAAESSIGRCERAKAHRDRELYKAGIRKSMQKLRSWDAYIDDACRL